MALVGLDQKATDARQYERVLSHLSKLHTSALDPDPNSFGRLVTQLMTKNVSWSSLIEDYFPKIAARLGEEWFADELGWYDVTIATGQMEQLVRRKTVFADTNNYDALIVVPHVEDHTFGAVMLAHQLYRDGFTVKLDTDVTADGLSKILAVDKPKLLGISASSTRTLLELPKLTEKARKSLNFKGQILLGGGLLTSDHSTANMGFDIQTNDINKIKSEVRK